MTLDFIFFFVLTPLCYFSITFYKMLLLNESIGNQKRDDEFVQYVMTYNDILLLEVRSRS